MTGKRKPLFLKYINFYQMKTAILFSLAVVLYSTGFSQNVGIDVNPPNAKLSISSYGTELAGSAASNLLRTNAGILGSLAGDEISLASIGFASNNNSSLGIRAYRTSPGTGWEKTAIVLGMDVDNTVRVGSGFLAISANGNIGISTVTPSFPLSFAPVLGDKISLWSNSTNSYGFGIQSGELQIHTDISAADIVFGYGSSDPFHETMRIKGTGNVGIGTSSPTCPLDVTGSLLVTGNFVNTSVDGAGVYGRCNNTPDQGIGVSGNGGYVGVYGQSGLTGAGYRNGLYGFGYNGTYNFGVYGLSISETGTSAYAVYGDAVGDGITWAGYFVGNVYTTGTYESSDRKLKNDIKAVSGALSILNQLSPSIYTYKTDEYSQMHLPEGLHYGLIADEVQLVVPGAVKKAAHPAQYENHNMREGKKLSDEVEFDAVNYTEMIPILIAAVKEQQVMIEELKIENQKIDLQQLQIDELKKLVLELAAKN